MDEKEFERMIDSKFYDLKLWFQNNGYMKPVGDMKSSTPKKDGYKISDKGCNRCGGKITWDLYNKEDHPYPDHVDEDGKLCDCPEYNPTQ